MLSLVCGIQPAEPGFRSVLIEPMLGNLPFAEGRMPHPLGDISVRFQKSGTNGLTGTIELPAGLSGTLRWRGKLLVLKPGKQPVNL
jgi:alpha-L-rhamnosidase